LVEVFSGVVVLVITVVHKPNNKKRIIKMAKGSKEVDQGGTKRSQQVFGRPSWADKKNKK
jgi:hypothetical protein